MGGSFVDRGDGGDAVRPNNNNNNNNNDGDGDGIVTVKLRMLEFFSGIGGMRISLENALKLLNDETSGNRNNNRDDDNDDDSSSGRRRRSSSRTTTTTTNTRFVLESCRAYDISLHANKVYRHNFCDDDDDDDEGGTPRTKLVEQLKPKDVGSFGADLWTMSPPCQPFTTSGEGRGKIRLDDSDKRCDGLKGILRLLDSLSRDDRDRDDEKLLPPRWILLENVRGFADSAMLGLVRDCLDRNGYRYRSFLLNPVEFGIPNHRTRFYLLAELRSKRWMASSSPSSSPPSPPVATDAEGSGAEKEESPEGDGDDDDEARPPVVVHGITSLSYHESIAKRPIRKVGRYILEEDDGRDDDNARRRRRGLPSTTTSEAREKGSEVKTDDDDPRAIAVVPPRILAKAWSKGLGIVAADDVATHCFTAGYGRIYHRSTGSLLLRPGGDADAARGGRSLAELPLDRSDMTLYEGQLRRFTPDELLRLFGFVEIDDDCNDDECNVDHDEGSEEEQRLKRRIFEIPPSLIPSTEQRYKLIGNSVNVTVVTELLRELLLGAAA